MTDGGVWEKSEVPANSLNGVPVCLGIDEAGRGPVLGPMVYGAAYWPVSENEEISAMGFDGAFFVLLCLSCHSI